MKMNSASVFVALIAIGLIAFCVPPESNCPAQMQYPIDVAAGPDDTLYVADRKLPGIWKIKDGQAAVFFQADARFGTPLNAIRCVAIDADGNLLAGDSATFTVYRFDAEGNPTPAHTGRIGMPMGIAAAADGSIYVSDIEIGQIVKIPPAADGATPERETIASVAAPRGLWLDGQDRLWIISAREGQLRRLEIDGSVTTVVEGMPFGYPSSVATIEGVVFVCDSYADTIFRVSEDGKHEELISGEPFVHPVGLSVSGGKLVVADSRANKIIVVDQDGTATAIELK